MFQVAMTPLRKTLKLLIVGALITLVFALVVTAIRVRSRRDVMVRNGPRESPARIVHSYAALSTPRGPRVASPEPAPAAEERDASGASAVELLERLRVSHTDAKLLHDAEQLSIAECMTERGFAYTPEPYDDSARQDADFSRNSLGDVDAARAVGFGLSDSLDEEAATRPTANGERLQHLSAAQRQSWNDALAGQQVPADRELANMSTDEHVGVMRWDDRTVLAWDRDSCAARAQRELHGDDVAHAAFEPRRAAIEREVKRAVGDDAEYKTALERWRGCMLRRGYHYETPDSGREKVHDEWASGSMDKTQLRTREVEVATSSAECYQDAQLQHAEASALSRVEPSIADDHRAELEALIAQHDRSVANAHEWIDANDVSPARGTLP